MLFRCTRNALKEFGLPLNADYAVDAATVEPLHVWYVNTFRYQRRKCLIFTNDTTLYTVIVVGVVKRDVARLGELFKTNVVRQLVADGIDGDTVEAFVAGFGRITYAKTVDRRTAGSMNDQVRVFKSHCDYREAYGLGDFEYENSLINDMPMKQGKVYIFPVQKIQQALTNLYKV